MKYDRRALQVRSGGKLPARAEGNAQQPAPARESGNRFVLAEGSTS